MQTTSAGHREALTTRAEVIDIDVWGTRIVGPAASVTEASAGPPGVGLPGITRSSHALEETMPSAAALMIVRQDARRFTIAYLFLDSSAPRSLSAREPNPSAGAASSRWE